jgi:hypothetical protein
MIPLLKSYIHKNSGAEDLSFMKITGKQGKNPNIILLIFSKGYLTYSAKFCQINYEHGKKLLEREYNILSFLRKSISNNIILETIPDVVSLKVFSNFLGLLTTALPGYHKIPDITNCNKSCINMIVNSFNWLEQYYLAQNNEIVELDDDLIELHIKTPIMKFNSNFKSEGKKFQHRFQRITDKWLELKGLKMPLILSHGDFNPHNILFNNQKVTGVVDWEDAKYKSFPFNDILHYCIVSGRENKRERDNIVHNFEDYYLKTGWYKEITDEQSMRLLRKINIENCSEVIDLYIPIYLASMAVKEKDSNRISLKRMHEWIAMLSIYFEFHNQ